MTPRYSDNDEPTLIFVDDDQPAMPIRPVKPITSAPSTSSTADITATTEDRVETGIRSTHHDTHLEIDLSDIDDIDDGPPTTTSALDIEISDDDVDDPMCWHTLRSHMPTVIGDYRIVGRRMLLRVNEPYRVQILELGWPIVSTHRRRQTAHVGSAIAISAPGIPLVADLLGLDTAAFAHLTPVPPRPTSPNPSPNPSSPDETEIRTNAFLLPHQREGVAWLRSIRRGVLGDDLGLGKCVARGTLVGTSRGLRRIETFGPEDKYAVDGFAPVIDPEHVLLGNSVVRFYREPTMRPARQITTTTGYTLTGTLGHRVLVRDDEGERLVPIGDVRPGMWCALYRGGDVVKSELWGLPTPNTMDSACNAKHHSVPRYLTPTFAEWLGLYVADGSCTKKNVVEVSVYAEAERAEQMATTAAIFQTVRLRVVTKRTKPVGWAFSSVRIRRWLVDLGIDLTGARGKRIPDCIMRAGGLVLAAFIRGLFHDSSIMNKEAGIEYSSASERLSHEVQTALLRLGIVCTRRPKHVNGWTYWRITLFGSHAAAFANRVGMPLAWQQEKLLRALGEKPRNTNIDILPLQPAVVLAVVDQIRAAGRFGRVAADDTLYRRARHVVRGQQLSYESVRLLIERAEGLPSSPALVELQRVVADGHFWSPIRDVYNVNNIEVCDIEVTHNDHRYVANGFVTHNTVQVLAALERELHADTVLFVTPSSMQLQWASEAKKWAPSFQIITPAGGTAAREVLATFPTHHDPNPQPHPQPQPRRGIVLTWDLLAPLEETLAAIPWDALITDEQHMAKSLGAKRTQALLSIAFGIPIRWFATGTPMLNRALELWPFLHLCDPIRFSHPHPFTQRFCGESGRLSCHPDELREVVKPYMLRRMKSLLDLPEQIDERLVVRPLTRPPHDARQIIDEISLAHRTNDTDLAARATKELTKLRQWAAVEKAQQAVSWISDHVSVTDPLVVFFTHKAAHDILKRGLKSLTLYDPTAPDQTRPIRVASIVGSTPKKKRQAYKEAFESGKIDVILGSEAARDGITLVRARLSLHVERWYTPEAESQAKGRIHRIGQTRDVTNVTMHLEDGFDEWMDSLVSAKSKIIRRVIDGQP